MRKYYGVTWNGIKRWTGKKVAGEEEAKRVCFGFAEAGECEVIELGTEKSEVLKKLKVPAFKYHRLDVDW